MPRSVPVTSALASFDAGHADDHPARRAYQGNLRDECRIEAHRSPREYRESSVQRREQNHPDRGADAGVAVPLADIGAGQCYVGVFGELGFNWMTALGARSAPDPDADEARDHEQPGARLGDHREAEA